MSIQTTSHKSERVGNQSVAANIFLAASIILLLASGWAWWHFVRSNPERTFYGMIENSLKTQGVTRQVVQENNGQKMEQSVQLSLVPQGVAKGYTHISQEGLVEASVKTENISTPVADYVRYTHIETDQKNVLGKSIDFSSLLNVWGRTDTAAQQSTGELYGESILGVVPVGNLSAENRRELMKLIIDDKVYQFGDGIKREVKDGRPVYTYDVKVEPEAYVAMLKVFAKSLGMNQLEQVNPADYKDSEPLAFKLAVDVWSRHLIGVEYSGTGRVESLGGHGVQRAVALPADFISIEALQTKLQSLQ